MTMRENEDRRWGRLGRYEEAADGRADQTRPRHAENPWWRERQSVPPVTHYDHEYRSGEAPRLHLAAERGYADHDQPEAGPPTHGARSRGSSMSWRPEPEVRQNGRTEGGVAQSGVRSESPGLERPRRVGPFQGESLGRQPAPATDLSARSGSFRGRGPRSYQRSDERVREDVCEALTESDELDASELEVAVSSGEVTLSGLVEDRRSKRLAEDIAAGCRGVKDVHNQLRIKQRSEFASVPPSVAPGERPSERPENGRRNRFS